MPPPMLRRGRGQKPNNQGSEERLTSLPVGIMDRVYIDCEFDGHNGPLLSFAAVKDNGDSIHITVIDAPAPRDPWVAENVLPIMSQHIAPKAALVRAVEVGETLKAFIGYCECPVIVADSPVDIARFCAAISTGSDGRWASTEYPAMRFEVHNVDCWPNDLAGAVQHNAWWDAMALRYKLTGQE